MSDFLQQIAPYITGVIIAGLVYLKSYLELKKLKNEVISITEQLQKSDSDYYVICPSCGEKIELGKVNIYCQKRTEELNDGDHN